MITEIRKNIYKIDQVLPNNPLQSLNVYLIKTEGKHLVIDMGFNHKQCEKILREAFAKLNVKTEDIDVLITHAHVDHIGTLDSFYGEFNRIITNHVTAEELHHYIDKTTEVMRLNNKVGGIPISEQIKDTETVTYVYGIRYNHEIQCIGNGSIIKYGEYTFRVLDLKGHSRGQLGLYEINEKFILGGDHILGEISPNISYWGDDFDALFHYLENLDKLRKISIEIIYPAHRAPIEKVNERINELIDHHIIRLKEIYDVIEEACTPYEVAKKVKWNFKNGDFNLFPSAQKWFATSEVLAHLEYLHHEGYLIKTMNQEVFYYKRSNKAFKTPYFK